MTPASPRRSEWGPVGFGRPAGAGPRRRHRDHERRRDRVGPVRAERLARPAGRRDGQGSRRRGDRAVVLHGLVDRAGPVAPGLGGGDLRAERGGRPARPRGPGHAAVPGRLGRLERQEPPGPGPGRGGRGRRPGRADRRAQPGTAPQLATEPLRPRPRPVRGHHHPAGRAHHAHLGHRGHVGSAGHAARGRHRAGPGLHARAGRVRGQAHRRGAHGAHHHRAPGAVLRAGRRARQRGAGQDRTRAGPGLRHPAAARRGLRPAADRPPRPRAHPGRAGPGRGSGPAAGGVPGVLTWLVRRIRACWTVRVRHRCPLLVAVVLAASMIGPVAAQAATPSPAAVTDPAALVDPLVGTGSGGDVVGQVDTFPGADRPFGMVQWSPDTPSRPDGGGYSDSDSSITGYSLTHVSGPGCAVAGDFPVLPFTGTLPADPASASASFSHSTESAHPGSYAVTAGGIRTQLAVTDRTGVAQFSYPATSSARLLFKVADSANGGSAATFQTVGSQEVTGSVTSGHFCGQPDSYTVYFAARFNRPFSSSGTWGGTSAAQVTRSPGSTSVTVHGKQEPSKKTFDIKGEAQADQQGSGVVAGGWLNFDTNKNQNVGMQVAVSYVSTAGALGNLRAEARTWNVGTVAAQATAAWNRQLGTIAIRGGRPAAQAEFYTALYHASLEPSLFSDSGGQYIGFDSRVHRGAG